MPFTVVNVGVVVTVSVIVEGNVVVVTERRLLPDNSFHMVSVSPARVEVVKEPTLVVPFEAAVILPSEPTVRFVFVYEPAETVVFESVVEPFLSILKTPTIVFGKYCVELCPIKT